MNTSYNIELEKLSKPNKNHNPQQIIKGKDKREERCKHKDNTRCVIEEETEALGVKPLRRPPSGNNPLENVVGIHGQQ